MKKKTKSIEFRARFNYRPSSNLVEVASIKSSFLKKKFAQALYVRYFVFRTSDSRMNCLCADNLPCLLEQKISEVLSFALFILLYIMQSLYFSGVLLHVYCILTILCYVQWTFELLFFFLFIFFSVFLPFHWWSWWRWRRSRWMRHLKAMTLQTHNSLMAILCPLMQEITRTKL